MSTPLFQPGLGYQSTQPKKSTTTKNVLLAGVSSLTYAATQLGCDNSNIIRDSVTFGVTNGLAQEFFPQLVQNENLQSLFIDPLIASLAQGFIKMLIYGDSVKLERVILKSIVAGVSASALTLHIHDGVKNY
jgi:hypothetical protein